MVCNNLIVGSHSLHNFSKTCVNVVNVIATFIEPTPTTNIITNETNLIQYSTKQGLKDFLKVGRGYSKKILVIVSWPWICQSK